MILCSGVFDGLHAGHVAYLRAAQGLRYGGEELVVAVAPDAYVRNVKGHAPKYGLEDRLSVVAALGMVHYAIRHSDEGVADAIRERHPRILVKGKDWIDKLPDDVLKACHDEGCSILFVPERATPHTSDPA